LIGISGGEPILLDAERPAMARADYHPQGWDAWIGIVFWLAVTAVVAGSIRTLWRLRK